MKSIFVSHVYEDKNYLEEMVRWENDGLMNAYTFTFETKDKRQEGYVEIKKHIQEKIEKSDILLVLIGNDTHNHDWIRMEVELANSFSKKIICVRIPNTTGALPDILKKKRIIIFKKKKILKALEG